MRSRFEVSPSQRRKGNHAQSQLSVHTRRNKHARRCRRRKKKRKNSTPTNSAEMENTQLMEQSLRKRFSQKVTASYVLQVTLTLMTMTLDIVNVNVSTSSTSSSASASRHRRRRTEGHGIYVKALFSYFKDIDVCLDVSTHALERL